MGTEDVGQLVSGLKVDEHKFVAVMQFARLERLVSNPLTASMPKMRELDARMQEYYELHEEIQRAFDTGKKANARSYAGYIMRINDGENGDTPTIDLYTPRPLQVKEGEDENSKAALLWEYDLVVVPYDGETQLAARFEAAKIKAETRKMPVVVTITHGKPVDFARQCFHDRNSFQRRASVGVSMAMDSRDVMVSTVRAIEAQVPAAAGTIEWRSRQMPKSNKNLIAAASFVRTAVVCFGYGIQGVQLDKDDVPEGLSKEEFMQRAILWFGRVIEKVGPYMKDRETFVASSPAIWAALGAMGKPLVDPSVKDPQTLAAMADSLIAKLNSVDWRKSDDWIGIAIKKTAQGYSFAGGAKDTGSVAYRALTESADPNFARIRPFAKAA